MHDRSQLSAPHTHTLTVVKTQPHAEGLCVHMHHANSHPLAQEQGVPIALPPAAANRQAAAGAGVLVLDGDSIRPVGVHAEEGGGAAEQFKDLSGALRPCWQDKLLGVDVLS